MAPSLDKLEFLNSVYSKYMFQHSTQLHDTSCYSYRSNYFLAQQQDWRSRLDSLVLSSIDCHTRKCVS